MCEHGNTKVLDYGRPFDVDECLWDLVRALNNAGFKTIACCCGHGKQPGNIALADGRELFIAPDYETGRAICSAFPPIN